MRTRFIGTIAAATCLVSCSGEETPQDEVDRIAQEILEPMTGDINMWARMRETPQTFRLMVPLMAGARCGERLHDLESREILDPRTRDTEVARERNCTASVTRKVFDTVNTAVYGNPRGRVATNAQHSPASRASAPAGTACSGYYAYLPADRTREVAFSIKVEPAVVEIKWIDFSPPNLMRQRVQPDGTLLFNIDGGGPSTLHCTASGATFIRAADQYGPQRSYQLVRETTDIFGVAQSRGWDVGD